MGWGLGASTCLSGKALPWGLDGQSKPNHGIPQRGYWKYLGLGLVPLTMLDAPMGVFTIGPISLPHFEIQCINMLAAFHQYLKCLPLLQFLECELAGPWWVVGQTHELPPNNDSQVFGIAFLCWSGAKLK